MLVLTRSIGEEVIVDGPARIMISSVRGQKVRLGFTAPHSTNIARSELSAQPGGGRSVQQTQSQERES